MNPLRLIAAFLARKTQLLAALRDEGGLFELRFLKGLLVRLCAALGLSTAESRQLQAKVARIRAELKNDLAPDDDTPGVLDRCELARLQRRLRTLGHDSFAHTRHLENLVQ